MNNSNIGFLFDLDGVLIDSEKEYSRIWREINKEFPTGFESLEEIIKGTTLDNILNTYFPDPELQKKVVERLYEKEGSMNYEYLPGALELLKKLKEKNIPTALVTSSNEVKMNHLKEELPGLTEMFDFIVTADLINSSKPHPEGYLLAASKIGVSPERCVVFEDSLQGVKAGKAADAFVVGVAGTLPVEVLQPFSDLLTDSLEKINIDNLISLVNKR